MIDLTDTERYYNSELDLPPGVSYIKFQGTNKSLTLELTLFKVQTFSKTIKLKLSQKSYMFLMIHNRMITQAQIVSTAINQPGLVIVSVSSHDTERVRCLIILFYTKMPLFAPFSKSEIATIITIVTGIIISHQLLSRKFEVA